MPIILFLAIILVPRFAGADTVLVSAMWPEFRAGQVGIPAPLVLASENTGR